MFILMLRCERHCENEPCFIRRGRHVDPPTVGLRDLRGDMQAQSQTLAAVAHVAPKERLEQPFHCRRWNGFAGIRDPQGQFADLGFRSHTYGLVRRHVLEHCD
jgi:hypothetical protein